MSGIRIGILSPHNLMEKQWGEKFFDYLENKASEWMPEKFGNWEPLKNTYTKGETQRLLDSWDDPFLWIHKKPRVAGSVWMDRPDKHFRHSCIYIEPSKQAANEKRVINIVRELSMLFEADLSYLHYLTDNEFNLDTANEIYAPFDAGFTTLRIRNYLPNLPWTTFFGPPYVKLIGRDKLLTTPAHLVEQINEFCIYVQLTERLTDFKRNYKKANEQREMAKDHLGRDLFFDPTGRIARYRAPTFSLGRQIY